MMHKVVSFIYIPIFLLLVILTACTQISVPRQSDLLPTVDTGESILLPPTSSPSALPTHTLTTTVTPTQLPPTDKLVTAVPTPTPTPAYPESHFIYPIVGHKQEYPLSCEASAASDWANFFGVSIYESSIQFALPSSDNPDYGFVGQVLTDAWGQIPPYAYGVHAGPIADALIEMGLPAKAVKNYSLEEVKQKLSENKPIIVWVIGNMVYSEPVEFIDSQGRSVIVAPYEHVVILTGYNQTHMRYMNNGRFIDTPIDVFLNSWGVLGNMAVIYE